VLQVQVLQEHRHRLAQAMHRFAQAHAHAQAQPHAAGAAGRRARGRRAAPSGTSVMEYTTTPVYAGVASVMRPRPLFSTWLPYRYCISAVGFTHTCARA